MLEVAPNIKKISIRQLGQGAFLGAGVSVDMVDLISEMFERGAAHIEMVNHNCPFMSAANAHDLAEVPHFPCYNYN